MARIKNPNPTPLWPWGGPKSVRERLVDPAQLGIKKKAKKANVKEPALPSAELMDFIGPAHSSEELRLPMPPFPKGHDADLAAFTDRPYLAAAQERAGQEQTRAFEKALTKLQVAPERLDRLKALLAREAEMHELIGQLREDIEEIQRRMKEETKEMGY